MKKLTTFAMILLCAVAVFSCKNENKEKVAAAADEAVAAVENAAEAVSAAAEQTAAKAADAVKRDIEAIEALDASDLEGGALNYSAVEIKPSFQGGSEVDFQKWIQANLKYPQDAIDKGEQGKVIAKFIVDKEGKIKDIKIVKSVSESLDAEAVRVLESAPNWTAGSQGGKAVNVAYALPVIFKLK